MKVTSGLFLLAICSAAAIAQQPPVPPTPPARAPRPGRVEQPTPPTPPAPARAPRVVRPGDVDYDTYYKRAMDAVDAGQFKRFEDLKGYNFDFKNDFKFDFKFDQQR